VIHDGILNVFLSDHYEMAPVLSKLITAVAASSAMATMAVTVSIMQNEAAPSPPKCMGEEGPIK
jgi:hypothetical protein